MAFFVQVDSALRHSVRTGQVNTGDLQATTRIGSGKWISFDFHSLALASAFVALWLPVGQDNPTSKQLRRESTQPRKRKRESYDHCNQIQHSRFSISVSDIFDPIG
jgi:hypothetical protein